MSKGLEEIKNNPVLSAVMDKFIQQTEKGLVKYGHSVNPDELSEIQWIDHFQEEMIDAFIYSEIFKQKLKELEESK